MDDEQRRTKRIDPNEDLERYIDEVKRKGESLRDETLQRLIFSPGGSAVMEEERRNGRGEGSGYDDDFCDALEFIRDDMQVASGSHVSSHDHEEVYEDAPSHFNPSSVTSPYSVVSPSMVGSLDPLSPNTNYAMHQMSRVSLCSPVATTPGYYPPSVQRVATSPHPVILPPPSLPPPSLPPPSLPPTSIQQPLRPLSHSNGYHSNSMPGPSYSSPMAQSPYIPQSIPLPPTLSNGSAHPTMNSHGPSSVTNPLFSPYPHPPSNQSYPIHASPYAHPPPSNQPYPMAPSPYPPMRYPQSVPMIHHQRAAQMQQNQQEMALFLSQQQQMTSRMISQVPPQMSRTVLHKIQKHHQPMHPPHIPLPPSHPSSSHPSSSQHSSSSFTRHPSSGSITSKIDRLIFHPHLAKYLPETAESIRVIQQLEYQLEQCQMRRRKSRREEEIARAKKKEEEEAFRLKKKMMMNASIGDLDEDDIREFNQYQKKMRKKVENNEMKKEKEKEKEKKQPRCAPFAKNKTEEEKKKEDEKKKEEERKKEKEKKLPWEKRERRSSFLSAFALPVGKQISDYYRRHDDDSPNPIIIPESLEYIDEVPLCTEGYEAPQLSRGHDNTKERRENPDLFGTAYLEKIQNLFHSVTGDPRRIPNKSTMGEKWEYPFKEGGVPPGMEVYFNVDGRMWNPEYDYFLVFAQLREISRRPTGFRFEPPLQTPKLTVLEKRTIKSYKSDIITNPDEVPEFGNVIVVSAGKRKEPYLDSDLSDCEGDGRIAIGRDEVKKIEKQKNRNGKKDEDKIKERRKKADMENAPKALVQNLNKKIHTGFYPVLMDGNEWATIQYYEKSEEVGTPFLCRNEFRKIYVDPNMEDEDKLQPDRFALAAIGNFDRCVKTNQILHQPDMTFYFKIEPGGYIVLGSDSTPAIFVQSPLYNAMMGEELDTIVKIKKGHEMIIYDENFFNLLVHQAYQYEETVENNTKLMNTMHEMKQMLLTRVSCTKGWGEAYKKSTIFDAIVWIEFSVKNGQKKLETLLTGNHSTKPRK